jgi:hypothetical protein
VFPDVLAGSVIAEDLMDGLIPTSDEPTPTPEPVKTVGAIQRKRATKPAAAASTQPPDAPKKSAQPDTDLDDLLDEPVPADPAPVLVEAEPAPDDTDSLLDDALDAEPVIDAEQIELITPAQLKKLAILLRQQGFETTESKHGFVCSAIERKVESSKDLTKDEASKVIDVLENGH